jgi:hypothetical protein
LDKAARAVPPHAGGGRGREGGVRAAAREFGISRTDARRAAHRAHSIAPAVREALRDMPEIADNGAELDALAALPAEQQAAAVAAVKSGGAPNVRVAAAATARPTLSAAADADNPHKPGETQRREALNSGATPSHPDVRGGPVQPINGPSCERVYAIGSVEWVEQQRRRANGV